jgi:hypothetical protein
MPSSNVLELSDVYLSLIYGKIFFKFLVWKIISVELHLKDNIVLSMIVVELVQGLWLDGCERVAFIGCLMIIWHLYILMRNWLSLLNLRRHTVEHIWWNAMENGSKPIVELGIDSRVTIDGNVVEYSDRVV